MTKKYILPTPWGPTPWEALPRLRIGQQAILLTALAEGYARLVATNFQQFWPFAENAVFNGRTVAYCTNELRRRRLAQLISSGCDLEYIAELAPIRTQEAAVAVAEDAAAIRRWLIKIGAASSNQRPVLKMKLPLPTP